MNTLWIQFIDDIWLGSCVRRLREALLLLPRIVIEDDGEDWWMPHPKAHYLCALARLTALLNGHKPSALMIVRSNDFRPDIAMIFLLPYGCLVLFKQIAKT